MRDNEKTVTNIYTNAISITCMKCRATLFSEDSSQRQQQVRKAFGKLPSDCVDSPIDGHKCPFITGKAFGLVQETKKIPKREDSVSVVC